MYTNAYESSQRTMKPIFGAVAVAATVATLGLAVIAPVALSPSEASAPEQVASRMSAQPMEVAILPGTIQVVAKRTKVAQSNSLFVPASYNVR